MRALIQWCLAIGSMLLPCTLIAYPEGPPWGAANPAHPDHCASCHWERAPQYASDEPTIRGLPDVVKAGERYALRLTFSDEVAKTAGFQLIIEGDREPAGHLSTKDPSTEIGQFGMQLRTMAPKALLAGRVTWDFEWQLPSKLENDVRLYVAVSAANDDGSPFGDVVHYRALTINAR